LGETIRKALETFADEVRAEKFPELVHGFDTPEE
jgi:ketopantoate hydroxymethyltransferase